METTEREEERVLRQLINLVVLVAVLWANAMAGAGTLSGESIGLIANRYTSFFLPANYVFGIWSLIYLALVGFTVHQVLPAKRSGPLPEAVGGWWIVNGVLNIAWVVLFSFSLFGPALAVMVALLASLIVLHVRLGRRSAGLTRADRVFAVGTFDLYLAWISVALIANTFQYVSFLGWGGWGVPGEVWSVAMMVAATALGGFMALGRGSWLFPLVVAWALWGIGVRFREVPLLWGAATWLVPLCGMAAVLALWRRRIRRPRPSSDPRRTPPP